MAEESLRDRELARFGRNLANFAKTTPEEAAYHYFYGILESQIVTLQCCGVITSQRAVKLHQQVADVIREKAASPSAS